MNLYIFTDIPTGLTPSYHSGGSAMVLAAHLPDAIALLHKEVASSGGITDKLPPDLVPSETIPVLVAGEPRVWIFPDAGCC